MNLFEYKNIGPEILQNCEMEWKMVVAVNAKIRNKEFRQGFLYIQKVYINSIHIHQHLYIFCIVCALCVCAKNKQRLFQVASCIASQVLQLQFVATLQKTYILYILSFKPFLVSALYKFSTVCTFFVYRNLMQIFCTLFIIQNFDLYNLCTYTKY